MVSIILSFRVITKVMQDLESWLVICLRARISLAWPGPTSGNRLLWKRIELATDSRLVAQPDDQQRDGVQQQTGISQKQEQVAFEEEPGVKPWPSETQPGNLLSSVLFWPHNPFHFQ